MNVVSHTWHRLWRNRREALGIVLAVLLLIVGVVATQTWWEEIKSALERTNAIAFFVLLCVLPLGGFSITLLHVVVGARFGGLLGMAIVTPATLAHLAGAHLIVRSVLRGPVERMLQRRGHHLPDLARREPVAVSLLGALVPGIPYSARNYLLALSGIPFRIYALIAWPIYVVRSGVAIFFGHWVGDLTAERIVILAAVFAVKVGTCAAIVWHLYRKHGRPGASATAEHRARPV